MWRPALLAAAIALVGYAIFVAVLVVAGRRSEARAFVRLVPDCARLFTRLLRDPAVPRRHRLLLAALVLYLASPIDLIPDFVPVAGQLDDAVLVALVLRRLLRGAGPELVRRHWPGPDETLHLVLRLAGRERPA